MYKVVITQPAEQDLQNAVQYIGKELRNPTAAMHLLDDLEKAINALSEMPHRNPLVRDSALAQNGFRLLFVRNYLVFYIVREHGNSVVIERILCGRRDWKNLL